MAEFEPVLLRRIVKKASPSLDAYRAERLTAFVAMLRSMGLNRPPVTDPEGGQGTA